MCKLEKRKVEYAKKQKKKCTFTQYRFQYVEYAHMSEVSY